MPPDKALTRVYAAYHLAALTLLLATLFLYLCVWFSPEQALVGSSPKSSSWASTTPTAPSSSLRPDRPVPPGHRVG